jgi:hypothetical protein
MERLDMEGFSQTQETLFLVAIILSFVTAALSAALSVANTLFADKIAFIKNNAKVLKIVQLAFALLPLLAVVFGILIYMDNGTNYLTYSDMLGTLYGYTIYERVTLEVDAVILPTIIVAALAFLVTIGAGIVDLLFNRPVATVEETAEIALTDAAEAPAENTGAQE